MNKPYRLSAASVTKLFTVRFRMRALYVLSQRTDFSVNKTALSRMSRLLFRCACVYSVLFSMINGRCTIIAHAGWETFVSR